MTTTQMIQELRKLQSPYNSVDKIADRLEQLEKAEQDRDQLKQQLDSLTKLLKPVREALQKILRYVEHDETIERHAIKREAQQALSSLETYFPKT